MNRASEFIDVSAAPTSLRSLLERSITLDPDDIAFLLDAENMLRHVDCDSAAERSVNRRLILFVRDIRAMSGPV